MEHRNPCTDKELADLAVRFARVADGVDTPLMVIQPGFAASVVSALIELQAARAVFAEQRQSR